MPETSFGMRIRLQNTDSRRWLFQKF